jgi:hypothetical protein
MIKTIIKQVFLSCFNAEKSDPDSLSIPSVDVVTNPTPIRSFVPLFEGPFIPTYNPGMINKAEMKLFLINKTSTYSNMLRDFINKHGYGSEKVKSLIFPEETMSV